MDSPDALPWSVLARRLTQILEASPRPEYLTSKDPCIHRIIRLRDIARYCRVDRQAIYRVRRGERSLKPELQKSLSWFFYNLDRGTLVKEKQIDGTWLIVSRNPAPQVHANEAPPGTPAIAAQVDFATGRLTVGRRENGD